MIFLSFIFCTHSIDFEFFGSVTTCTRYCSYCVLADFLDHIEYNRNLLRTVYFIMGGVIHFEKKIYREIEKSLVEKRRKEFFQKWVVVGHRKERSRSYECILKTQNFKLNMTFPSITFHLSFTLVLIFA